MITEAYVNTEHGRLYLKKLCRHFARKVPVTVAGVQGRIDLPFGQCRIQVCDEHMYFHVNVGNEDDVDLAEQVVSDHLLRMANEEKPDFQWMRQK